MLLLLGGVRLFVIWDLLRLELGTALAPLGIADYVLLCACAAAGHLERYGNVFADGDPRRPQPQGQEARQQRRRTAAAAATQVEEAAAAAGAQVRPPATVGDT